MRYRNVFSVIYKKVDEENGGQHLESTKHLLMLVRSHRFYRNLSHNGKQLHNFRAYQYAEKGVSLFKFCINNTK